MSDDYASISQAKPINIVALLDAIVKPSFVSIYIQIVLDFS